MFTITRLTQQKRQNRVNVYLDGKFAFGVTLESALENHLKVGKELTSSEVETLRGKDFKDKVLAKLLNFASRRPHSQKEISLWFRKKNVPPEIYQYLFSKLENIGLLNDEEFARWWVEQRVAFRAMPPRMLKVELQNKGVDREIIEKVLGDVESPTEEELAKKTLLKRFGGIPNVADIRQKKKVYDLMLRRGFSYSVIKKTLAQSGQEEYN